MKRLLPVFCLTLSIQVFGQAPSKFNYQAVIRDANGELVKSSAVGMRFSIIQGSSSGNLKYIETHLVLTNENGLVTSVIGDGAVVNGDITSLDWSNGPYFLKSEIDPSGGTNYSISATAQLLTVPYALYAENAANVIGAEDKVFDGDSSASNELQELTLNKNELSLSKNGGSVTIKDEVFDGDSSSTNELQKLTISGNVLSLSGSGSVNLPKFSNSLDTSTTNEIQNLSYSSNSGKLSITNGNSVNITNELNDLKDVSKLFNSIYMGNPPTSVAFGSKYNYALGDSALFSITTGQGNTAFGRINLFNNRTGLYNSAIGFRNLITNDTGNFNIAIGTENLLDNLSDFNIGIGTLALLSNTTGRHNTGIGLYSLGLNSTGNYNVSLGRVAGYNNTSGSLNTAIGDAALYYNQTGNYNTAIGVQANNSTNTANSNTIGVGYGANPNASNSARIGNASMTSIGGQVSWSSLSDARFKENVSEDVVGLDFILKLKPVTYNFNLHQMELWKKDKIKGEKNLDSRADLQPFKEIEWDGKYDLEKMTFSGFLAQEVESAAKASGYNFSGVDKPKNDKDTYGLRYAEFVVPIIKAIQEQQAMIETQQKMIRDLKDENETLRKEFSRFRDK